ncbi:MAG: lysophospholipid acyltransferase family protein [Bacteroidales bacterium]
MLGKKIGYYLFRITVFKFKLLPFRAMYILADGIAFLLNYIIPYRKSVVMKNLHKCFPEKNEKEIIQIRKNYYRIFSDLLLETLKGTLMNKKQLVDRFRVINPAVSNKFFEKGQDVIMVLGHFANWEWATASLVECLKHHPAVLYKPISNIYIDDFIKKSRARFGIDLVSIYQTGRYFLSKKAKPVAYYMIADQYSPNKIRQITANFFHSQTGFLNGPEKYAKLLNIPVIYTEIRREKRGFYTMELFELCEDPAQMPPGEITQRYANFLENSIKKQPENWIWTHKRWKKELYSFD